MKRFAPSLLLLGSLLGGCRSCGSPGQGKPDAGLAAAPPARQVAPPANPVPTGMLREETASSQLVLFPSNNSLREAPVEVVAGIAARDWPALHLERPETVSQVTPAVVVAAFDSPGASRAEVARGGHGLSGLEEVQLQRKARAAILEFHFSSAQALRDLPRAQELALSVAAALGGAVILDGDSREYFSLASWKQERVESWSEGLPAIPRQIAILQTPEDEKGSRVRSVTFGMAKFGLPDVVVAHHDPGTDARGLGSLINLVCATLVERPAVDREGLLDVDVSAIHEPSLRSALQSFVHGGRGKATVALATAAPQPGDPENRLIEIAFPAAGGGSVRHAQEALLSELFGD